MEVQRLEVEVVILYSYWENNVLIASPSKGL